MADDKTPHSKDAVKDALDVLIKQFGNRFDFVRELVQNSLDSGTREVDVWTAYHPGNPMGVCEIHVDDNGIGMDEHVIDEGLTRLFASTKEDDLTCIGKFGIGFASVFSLDPEGVLVKTARGGERWEVFFDKAHNVEKTAIDEPIEGTKITIFKSMSESDYKEAAKRVFEMLKYWCRYAERRILFRDTAASKREDDASSRNENVDKQTEATGRRRRRGTERVEINEPMTVEGDFPIKVQRGEAEIAMAFSSRPLFGFYNRGLTLKETNQPEILGWAAPFFRNVSFRVKSPHLEHTLTRDTILMDDNYQKVLTVLVDTAREQLVEHLVSILERCAASAPMNSFMSDEYMQGLRRLFELNREMDPVFGFGEKAADTFDTALEKLRRAAASVFRSDREIKPDQKSVDASKRKLFRRCFGGPCTLSEMEREIEVTDNRLILSDRENEATRELFDRNKPVFFAPLHGGAEAFFARHLGGASPKGGEREKVFVVGFDTWLVEPLEDDDLDDKEKELFELLSKTAGAAGLSLVPVNFLGDNPTLHRLGAALQNQRFAMSQPASAPKPETVAVDIRGLMFQKLCSMLSNEKERELALLIAAGEAALWCGNDASARAAVMQWTEKDLR